LASIDQYNRSRTGESRKQKASSLPARDDTHNWLPLPQATLAWGSPPPHRPLRAVRGPQEGNKGWEFNGAVSAANRHEPQETTIEPIETSLADRIRKFRASPDVVRSNVRVSDDVFSRVTAFFANNRVKKVDILSYLLFAFLPKRKPSGHLPQWLLQIPPVARTA
jgi:hypothetical protein